MNMRTKLPGMSDAELTTLRGNAERLSTTGSAVQRQAATDLLPDIVAELSSRRTARLAKARADAEERAEARAKRPRAAKAAKQPN